MSDIPIKLRIADRDYPMRVAAADEEMIRQAGKELNERLKSYREKFKLDDKQDLLAMATFDCLMEKARQQSSSTKAEHFFSDKLTKWGDMLTQTLAD